MILIKGWDIMSDKHIGIIIQNQDKKILMYGDTCYIKVKINKDDDINKIIASKASLIVFTPTISISFLSEAERFFRLLFGMMHLEKPSLEASLMRCSQ